MANKASLKPFTKGDKRINRKGRPKTLAELRALAQSIAHREVKDDLTVTEAILTGWAGSKNPKLQQAFIEYAYGKPPQQVENTLDGKITHEIIVRRGKNIPRPNRAASGTDDSAEGSEAV